MGLSCDSRVTMEQWTLCRSNGLVSWMFLKLLKWKDLATRQPKYSNAQNLWSKNIFFTFFQKKTEMCFFFFHFGSKEVFKKFFSSSSRKEGLFETCFKFRGSQSERFIPQLTFFKDPKNFFFSSLLFFFFFLLKCPIFFFFRWISTPGMFYRWKKQLSSDDSMSSLVLKLCSREANALAKISRCVFLLSMELSVTRLFGKIWPVLATF